MSNCVKWQGDVRHYQQEAVGRYVHVWQMPLGAYSFVRTTCEDRFCLNVDHMQIARPRRLEYPTGVCTYCGMPGYTKDHIEPKTWTGASARQFVVTVPSCGECNRFISDSFAPTIEERREIAQIKIRKRYKRVLSYVDFTPEELEEFEGNLLDSVLAGIEEKRIVQGRLNWPEDHSYDLRALEKSGLNADEILDTLASRLVHA